MSIDATIGTGDTTAWLVRLLGGKRAAELEQPLTATELELVEEGLARHNGDPVAAAGVHVDADTAAFMRSLPVGGRR